MMKLAWLWGAAACALAGCSVALEPVAEPPPVVAPAAEGSLTVRWLVAGTNDAAVCDHYGLDAVQIITYDAAGRPVSRDAPPCGSFSVTIPLPEGTYSADVVMLDRSRRAVTSPKTLDAIEIVAGTDLAINMDFPLDSIR